MFALAREENRGVSERRETFRIIGGGVVDWAKVRVRRGRRGRKSILG